MNGCRLRDVVGSFVLLAVVVAIIVFVSDRLKPSDIPPELIASHKVGDEPHYHRVWRVVVNGEAIEYVEIVVPK